MTELHNLAAERLRSAYSGTPVPPLREFLEPNDEEGAYRIQAINTKYWTKAGRRVVGRKIGLTARAVQAQLGVAQPDYGVLFEDRQLPDGGTLTTRLLQPRVEAEVAFIMGADVTDSDVTPDRVAAAVAAVCAAVEIVDSRIEEWKITYADTVADNGSSAFFVLGGQHPLSGLDLWTCGMVLELNEEVASVGAGAACLGHPMNSATWLARTLARQGSPLRAGELVMTGALGPMVPLRAGDRVKATVAGLGTVQLSYRPLP